MRTLWNAKNFAQKSLCACGHKLIDHNVNLECNKCKCKHLNIPPSYYIKRTNQKNDKHKT